VPLFAGGHAFWRAALSCAAIDLAAWRAVGSIERRRAVRAAVAGGTGGRGAGGGGNMPTHFKRADTVWCGRLFLVTWYRAMLSSPLPERLGQQYGSASMNWRGGSCPHHVWPAACTTLSTGYLLGSSFLPSRTQACELCFFNTTYLARQRPQQMTAAWLAAANAQRWATTRTGVLVDMLLRAAGGLGGAGVGLLAAGMPYFVSCWRAVAAGGKTFHR